MFIYTNNKTSKKAIKKAISFTIASKTIKYLGINLTNEVEDLYIVLAKIFHNILQKKLNELFWPT